jgi:hypothetical protein
VGDPLARKVFKEEIAKRFAACIPNVMIFLLEQKFLDFFDDEEIELLIRSVKEKDLLIYRYLLPILMKHKYVYQDFSEVKIERKLMELYEDLNKGLFDEMDLDDYFWRLREKIILQMKLEYKKEKK